MRPNGRLTHSQVQASWDATRRPGRSLRSRDGPARRPIEFGRFVEMGRHALQPGQDEDEREPERLPQVDHDDGWHGPGRREQPAFRGDARLPQVVVDEPEYDTNEGNLL